MVVAGGSEAVIHPLPIAAFASMRALSTRNDEPSAASRPYDKGRDGFVMGEGAGDPRPRARVRRRAPAARRSTACSPAAGMTSDAHDVVAPEPTGAGAARALAMALRDAGLAAGGHRPHQRPRHLDPAGRRRRGAGDAPGARRARWTRSSSRRPRAAPAICSAPPAPSKRSPPCSPCATGSPRPPATWTIPTTPIDLDVARLDPRPLRSGPLAAASNSFGFGGHNVSLVFRSN